ncbi:hypothetical protein [Virgibacillus sediminis]|uniref:Uncharacterized protein n=1 Tax=Virgibacillus sediminis TaxID=202260 RepID=A0ABV7A1E9_9BACI
MMAWEEQRIDQNIDKKGDIDKWVHSTCNLNSSLCRYQQSSFDAGVDR